MGPPQISNLIPSFNGSILEGLVGAGTSIGNLVIDTASNFYDSVVNFLTLTWDFISGTTANVSAVIRIIFTTIFVSNTIQPFIWAPIAASMTIVVLVAVVKVILGWGNT